MKVPASEEAEEALVASIMLDETLLFDAIQHHVTSDSFNYVQPRLMFEALVHLTSTDQPIDQLGVITHIKDCKQTKSCSMADVFRIQGTVETSGPYKNARNIVVAKAAQRAAIGEIKGVLKALEADYSRQEDIDGAVAPGLARCGNALKSASKARTTKEITQDARTRAKQRMSGEVSQHSISWGLPSFDQHASEIEPHELVFVAARPSIGKSSLANNIAWTNVKAGKRVASFLLETSDVSQIESFAATETGGVGSRITSRGP